MWSALRSCLSVYLDFSPRGMAASLGTCVPNLLAALEVPGGPIKASAPQNPMRVCAFRTICFVADDDHCRYDRCDQVLHALAYSAACVRAAAAGRMSAITNPLAGRVGILVRETERSCAGTRNVMPASSRAAALMSASVKCSPGQRCVTAGSPAPCGTS